MMTKTKLWIRKLQKKFSGFVLIFQRNIVVSVERFFDDKIELNIYFFFVDGNKFFEIYKSLDDRDHLKF